LRGAKCSAETWAEIKKKVETHRSAQNLFCTSALAKRGRESDPSANERLLSRTLSRRFQNP